MYWLVIDSSEISIISKQNNRVVIRVSFFYFAYVIHACLKQYRHFSNDCATGSAFFVSEGPQKTLNISKVEEAKELKQRQCAGNSGFALCTKFPYIKRVWYTHVAYWWSTKTIDLCMGILEIPVTRWEVCVYNDGNARYVTFYNWYELLRNVFFCIFAEWENMSILPMFLFFNI